MKTQVKEYETDLVRRRMLIGGSVLTAAALVPGVLSAAPPAQQATFKETSAMKTRKLGALEVSELGAGCMSISCNYGPPAEKTQGIATIRAAYESRAASR